MLKQIKDLTKAKKIMGDWQGKGSMRSGDKSIKQFHICMSCWKKMGLL